MQGKKQRTDGNCPPIDLLCENSTVGAKACEDEVPEGMSSDGWGWVACGDLRRYNRSWGSFTGRGVLVVIGVPLLARN